MLDETPPDGYSQWNGRRLAAALGDVSIDQVRRVLRAKKLQLQRKRSWCISTDPQFGTKAADVVALYLNPPENALVLSVDEKPHIQALERAQGYLRLPNGTALRGVSHEYKRHGTSTLFAALEVMTGKVFARHTKRHRRREFLAFMNEVVALYPERELHIVLDNLSTHKPKHGRWLARHPNVHPPTPVGCEENSFSGQELVHRLSARDPYSGGLIVRSIPTASEPRASRNLLILRKLHRTSFSNPRQPERHLTDKRPRL